MKELSFKLATKAWKVTLEDADGGKKDYEIREVKSAVRERYMDNLSKRLQLDTKGNIIGLKKYEGMQSDLLTICMHDMEGDGKKVLKEQLDGWPGTVVEKLFRAAQVINLLRKPDERNRIISEQIIQFLEKRAEDDPDLTAEDIEGVIEDADKKMFDEASEDSQNAEEKTART